MRDLAYRILFAICLALALPLAVPAAFAQDATTAPDQSEDDKGFITRLLEDNLSGAGRKVVIDGFKGALSSRATFSRMTISDDNGIWITIENGAMHWSRTALLTGNVHINELSADRIIMPRLPGSSASAPQAETKEFALPQLPVSVNIEKLSFGRVELGKDVIGQEAVLAVDGSMNLDGGEGATKLTINRVDGPRGQFALDASFSNDTRVLGLDLKLDEDRNGLFANIVDLYGRPAVNAEIKGQGPLSNYVADISLATDGQPRVTGNVAVTAQQQGGVAGTSFRVQVGGDVAALAPPEHKPFFGSQSQLLAEGWAGADGRLLIPSLNLTTAGSIPADVSAVLINAPGADLTDAETTILKDYVANGGKLFVTTDFTTGTPNLDSVLADCGMARQPGLLIETDTDHYPYGYPQTYLLPKLAGNDITAGVSQSMMIYTPIAQGITTNDDSEFAFTDLLTTGDNAYAMENYATAETAQKADTDPEGCFAVAVAADNSATGARVVWVNCPNLLESNINQAVSGGNAQFLGSVVNWMNGEQTTAVINAKSMSAASLSVPTSAAIPLGVLFTLVLPIVCIIAGAVVCVVRRRR